MQSQTVEQPASARGGIGLRAGDRDWPVLAGLGLVVVLLLALGFTVSGAGRASSGNAVAAAAQGAQVLPAGVAVACGAGQQALLKQVETAGQAVVQVECVPAAGVVGASALTGYAPGALGVGSTLGTPTLPGTARAIPAVYAPANDEIVYRPPARRTVVERRSGRSWQKSAVIIGSSAGIGAGVGAAVGGKKGALIGAAVGGGSAAIWDQVTRKKR